MKVSYLKMSLFDAPEHSVMVHACNCRGFWGRGIAKEFARRFPSAYANYSYACKEWNLLGRSLIIKEDFEFEKGPKACRSSHVYVGCLFTSYDFGPRVSPPDVILENTRKSLGAFMEELPKDVRIFSNKFNSGLFGVPWEKTEALIKEIDDEREWTVCDLDG